jgi:uncharacterized RDD family membrane protein YckC
MKIKCPACSTVLDVPDNAAGKLVKCPCGKQLRAPGGAPSPQPPTVAGQAPARPAAGRPAASQPAAKQSAAKQPAASQPASKQPAASQPAAKGGEFDAAMLDELTTRDLKPIRTVASVKAAPAAGTTKLLQQHASTAGGGGGGPEFRRGPLASPWIRLGASLIDGIVIALLAVPVLAAMMYFLVPMLVDVQALQNAENPPTPEEQQAIASKLLGAYLASAAVAYVLPIVLYAVMITKTGQTPGKKLCGIRILKKDSGELPGFVNGVLLRSWLKNVAYSIPFVGALIALADALMIFTEERQCLHDRIAGTIVVES